MYCPNCGKPYTPNEFICKNCGQPLGNASYSTLKSEPKKKPAGRAIKIIIFLVLGLALAAGIAYYAYLHIVESRCRKVTDQIFTAAKTYDLSAFPPDQLPDQFKDADLRQMIADRIEQALSETSLGSYFDISSLGIDWDPILDEIASDAEYKIVDVKSDYHSCRVKVHTQNKDFSALPSAMLAELEQQLTKKDSTFWETVKEKIYSFFTDEESSDQDTADLKEVFLEIYDHTKESLPTTDYEGEIVYGIKDGSWTILSYDENLFYKFYGMPGPDDQQAN